MNYMENVNHFKEKDVRWRKNLDGGQINKEISIKSLCQYICIFNY